MSSPLFVFPVGGIDFGYNSPLAAVWGVLDDKDILWLEAEHFCRGQPLSYHAKVLPKAVFWYCDPSGANERAELRHADFKVVNGINAIRSGIAAVTARIQTGRLRIIEGKCPSLLLEAGLYHYDPRQPFAETPVDEDNHSLDALRYLIATLDARRQVKAASTSPALDPLAKRTIHPSPDPQPHQGSPQGPRRRPGPARVEFPPPRRRPKSDILAPDSRLGSEFLLVFRRQGKRHG